MRQHERTAFTLLEVLVALAVAAIAVGGLMRLHLLSLGAADKAEKMAQALSIAQNKLAEVTAAGAASAGAVEGCVELNRTPFRWQTQVSDFHLDPGPAGNPDRLHKVTVTVAWAHGLGRKDVSVSTLLCDGRRP
jgi:type II secretion system protein I